ncbi:MAG: bifunctional demethylmenaquinone methyltransferase/2-methoxy-6-polyprenyl-1,4-benzoquinol methylase UbiE [Bacteroidia bacterium]|nr:bifunctional demethylmenaquinone methyltransferase/2-methoxy-6-polyprenyl-1,4-benzoquinol methylase UbiE [Bacteroidia bacterium]
MPKKTKIKNMFDSIAPEYDRLNHLMSLNMDKLWRRRALQKIVIKDKSQQILDIACGTGDFSIAIAESANPSTKIEGIDISEGMLEVMRNKLSEKGLDGRVSARLGDSEALPYGDGSFDRVTIAFGIRNFEHREKALEEILRVLKPGGRLVILELSIPSNALVKFAFKLYFTKFVPLIGGKISGDKGAYSYLPESVIKFPGKKEWIATMESCGYSQVTHKAFTFGICRMYTGEKK